MIPTFDAIKKQVTLVVLAGGQGSRMGNVDKGLVNFKNESMIEHVLQRCHSQVSHILINANRHIDQYTEIAKPYGAKVISDQWQQDAVAKEDQSNPSSAENSISFQGPLAGMHVGLSKAKTDYILCVPCDAPLISENLCERLMNQCLAENADIAVVSLHDRWQPVFCIIKTKLKVSLEQYLQKGERKIDRWFINHKVAIVDFSDQEVAFTNLNTMDDLKQIETHVE